MNNALNTLWAIPILEIGGRLFYEMNGQLKPVSKEPITWEQLCKKIDEMRENGGD